MNDGGEKQARGERRGDHESSRGAAPCIAGRRRLQLGLYNGIGRSIHVPLKFLGIPLLPYSRHGPTGDTPTANVMLRMIQWILRTHDGCSESNSARREGQCRLTCNHAPMHRRSHCAAHWGQKCQDPVTLTDTARHPLLSAAVRVKRCSRRGLSMRAECPVSISRHKMSMSSWLRQRRSRSV